MTEAQIARVAEALELRLHARLKRAPTASELRAEAEKLLIAYLKGREERLYQKERSKAA